MAKNFKVFYGNGNIKMFQSYDMFHLIKWLHDNLLDDGIYKIVEI